MLMPQMLNNGGPGSGEQHLAHICRGRLQPAPELGLVLRRCRFQPLHPACRLAGSQLLARSFELVHVRSYRSHLTVRMRARASVKYFSTVCTLIFSSLAISW